MSYAAVTVVLQLGCSNEAPLCVADDLARRLDIPVTGIARAQPMTVLMGDNFFAGEIVEADQEAIEAEAKAAETEFRIAISDSPNRLTWDMAVTTAPLWEPIASAAKTADILVAGIDRKGDASRATRMVDVESLIESAGRPVLAVPRGVGQFGFGCALVAWKNSREARRAIADALPLLRLMHKVVIVEIVGEIDDSGLRNELDRMVTWLGRHGISALSRMVPGGGDDGEQLLALAKEERAELIVAGSYGHNRYREWVLGGVTRTLLDKSPCCLLMSR